MKQKVDRKKDTRAIIKLLNKFFEKESIFAQDNLMFFPLGSIFFEKGSWRFSLDFTYITEPQDCFTLLLLMENFHKKGIQIKLWEPHHTIFNNKDICCGAVFQHEIIQLSEELGVTDEGAYNILRGRLIDFYNEEQKTKTDSKKSV